MLLAKNIGFSMFNELIGPADPFDLGVDLAIVKQFDDGSAEAIGKNVIFEGAHHL